MKKRVISLFLVLIIVLGMLPILETETEAYFGNEMMDKGDVDVTEAIMLNMVEFSYKLAEKKGDISFLYDSPAAAFVDEKVRALIGEIPEYGEDLEKVYNASMLLFEAAWDLGNALAQVGRAREELMTASINYAANHQKALINIVSIAYNSGVRDYQQGKARSDEEIISHFSTSNSTDDVVQDLRENADSKIFLFDKESARKIDKVADELASLKKVLMSPVDAYHLGWDVAETMAKSLEVESGNDSVDARLKQLVEMLEGKYFTTTGTSCGNNNCSSCKMINIIGTDYLKSLVNGFVPDSSVVNSGMYHNFGDGNKFVNGASCCGFANFAAWYIFAENKGDKVGFNCVCPEGKPVSFTEEGLKSTGIKPGDVLRISNHPTKGAEGHSAIFIEFADNGIRVLDSNYGREQYGYNRVRTHVIAYQYYSHACVSRAENYDEVSGLPENSYVPDPNSKTQYRYHVYVNENGARNVCPTSGMNSYPGTTYHIEYTEWLDAPLPIDNGQYSGYKHGRLNACASNGCVDEEWTGNRHLDASGNTWFYEETRKVPQNCSHSWDSGTVTIAASCNNGGEITYLCTVCGEITKETLDATGHSYGEWLEIKSPTEYEPGEEQSICANCGDAKVNELPAIGHTHKYNDKVTAPTCTEEGYTTHSCECGESYIDSIVAATGHKWDDGTVTTEPTEDAEGKKTYICSVCRATMIETIAPLGHTHKYASEVISPSCTENGYTKHTCSCGDTYMDSPVAATGHKWDGGKVTKEPTAETEGEKTYTCTVCGGTKTEQTEKLQEIPPVCSHVFKNKYCINCGAREPYEEKVDINYRKIKIVLDGEEITPCDGLGNTVEPFIMSSTGTTYLPLRAVSQALGLYVHWDEPTNTVNLSSGGTVKTGLGPSSDRAGQIRTKITYRNIRVILDGKLLSLVNSLGVSVDPFILNDNSSVYLPLRIIGEALGITVHWDGDTSTVYLITNQG